MARDCALVVRREVHPEVSAADWPDGPLEASASAARDGRSQLCPTAGRELTNGGATLLNHHVGPAAVVYGRGIRVGYGSYTNNSSDFRCRPPLTATACASLTARRAQAMAVKVNVIKEPSRRSRIANPAACVFCVLTLLVMVPLSLGMKDAFVPSSVLRLRRRLFEDKVIDIDIADVLFAGMVFPVMKYVVKKIVLPRVRAWEKVKEVAKKMACTEAPPVSDLESQSESNGSTDDLDHA